MNHIFKAEDQLKAQMNETMKQRREEEPPPVLSAPEGV